MRQWRGGLFENDGRFTLKEISAGAHVIGACGVSQVWHNDNRQRNGRQVCTTEVGAAVDVAPVPVGSSGGRVGYVWSRVRIVGDDELQRFSEHRSKDKDQQEEEEEESKEQDQELEPVSEDQRDGDEEEQAASQPMAEPMAGGVSLATAEGKPSGSGPRRKRLRQA